MLLRCLPVVLLFAACQSVPAWSLDLRQRLPRLGHRNVIAVVDAAYPAQTSPGITTVCIGGDQIATVQEVLAAVRAAGHVRADVVLDTELKYVSDLETPGIGAYRTALGQALTGAPVRYEAHADTIAQLATTAKDFEVLVLKTDLRLPYTSVFVWLDCGYWDAAREAALRQAMPR